MKKVILYLIVAALAPVVMPANATNSSPHPSVVENNPTAMRSPGFLVVCAHEMCSRKLYGPFGTRRSWTSASDRYTMQRAHANR